MNNQNPMLKNSLALFLVTLGIATRLLPHMPNFTPVTAIALTASVYLGLRYSLGIILAVMFAADAIIGFYSWQIMLSVYGSLIVSSLIGLYIKKRKQVATVFWGTLNSSLFFFFVTNWAVWQFSAMYPHSFIGLMQSYAMGIPFLKNSLAGDFAYTAVLFGVFELALYLAKKGAAKKAILAYRKSIS